MTDQTSYRDRLFDATCQHVYATWQLQAIAKRRRNRSALSGDSRLAGILRARQKALYHLIEDAVRSM